MKKIESHCFTGKTIACSNPKPLTAPLVLMISGQCALISSTVNTSLLLLKASSGNFKSCLII